MLVFIGTSRPSFLKALYQFLHVHYVCCCYLLFFMASLPFHLYSFHFGLGILHLRMLSTSYYNCPPTSSGWGLISRLWSGYNVYFLNGLNIGTWNVGCILISGGNSNLYLSLNTRSTIENGHPWIWISSLEWGHWASWSCVHWTTLFGPSHTPLCIFRRWLALSSTFGFFPTTT